MLRTVLILLGITITIGFLGWLGLQIKPKPFFPYPTSSADLEVIPLPKHLPSPVVRFYNRIYGDTVPVINTAVISGRGRMQIKGITFPVRFRFTHASGQAYRHYIEVTMFGLTLMKVNEHYLDGESRLELPFGISEGAKVDQGANLALWAEAVWMPSLWVTDPRLRWEGSDPNKAFLIVPFGEEEERICVHFDTQTGKLLTMESMRFKASDSPEKTPWLNKVVAWGNLDGNPIPRTTTITWLDEGSPWAVFNTENIVYNEDVRAYIRAKGE